MPDLADRIDALRQAQAAPRQAAWDWLKAQDPAQAAWLAGMTAAFGKPTAVRVEDAEGTVIYENGELHPRNKANMPLRALVLALATRNGKI